MNRKGFLTVVGTLGAGTCMCAAVGGMRAALGEEPVGSTENAAAGSAGAAATQQPGEKTLERAAKRVGFVDGWVKRFFDAVDQTLDEPTRRKLMEANGRSCFIAYAGPPRREPVTMERLRAWVAENGKERGYSIEGDAIAFEFVSSAETGGAAPEGVCLCTLAETQAPGSISPTYCHCSVGYVREMHERIFGKPVAVELVDSVLRGGKRCRFRMTVA
jgi:hypothetical protein